LPHISTVENLHASDSPGDNVKYQQRPFVRHQAHIPVTGAETAFWFRVGVKRGAEVVPTAAPLQNFQSRHLK
jgi:hypothetical protein